MNNKLILKYCILLVLLISTKFLFAESGKILISEFMAINSKTINDEDGDDSDWLELFNPGDNAVNLNGWFLTDKADDLSKWQIPDITLGAGEYLLIFASEKKRDNPTSELHTNFKLTGSGEFLAIVESDGETISHSYGDMYPAQRNDISYGIYQGQLLFFDQPTPGTENVLGNIVQTPQFSKSRGFYQSAIDVVLSAPENGASIYYTLDGTRPDKNNGTPYTTPIQINKTTPLSAISVNSSNVSSEIISNTYWFIEDILKQNNSPEGYPSDWKKAGSSTSIPADYEMDSEICDAPEYKNQMEGALKSVPSMSIVTSKHYLFSNVEDENEGGIYIFTGKPSAKGVNWVRPTSAEYYDPSTGKQFQINCQLKLHGGNSRNPGNSPKHGFQLRFKSAYGPSKLNFTLFEEKGATKEFNALVLRAGYNYSWTKNNETQRTNAQYLQDPFAKNVQLAMGQPSAHERFVHLYINGIYWGLFNLSEKITNDFMESYLNGDEEDFDVVKDHGDVVDGDRNAWNKMLNAAKADLTNNTNYQKIQGKNTDGTLNPNYDNLLDIGNLIDYMIYNIYIGNGDWDKNNWIAARNKVSNDAGFRFFAWDAETSMTDINFDNANINNNDNPSWLYQRLKSNKDFKILFADKIQKNLFNNGPLSPDGAIANYTNLADEMELAIIAESARWGDYRRDVDNSSQTLYTKNDYWIPQKDYLLNNYFPYRTDIVVQQFRDIGLFPNIEAPVFSEESGEKTAAIDLGMTTNYGEIYYTIDGTDPREQITSNVVGKAKLFTNNIPLSTNATVKARAKSGNEWSPITIGNFDFGDITSVPELAKIQNISAGNYPNPFSETTQIYFTLPNKGDIQVDIQVDIISIEGRLIKNIHKGYLLSGYHKISWNPTNEKAGIYLYKINVNGQNYFGKIIKN